MISGENPPSGKPATGLTLVLGALGVVFGDIGTSPLYAFEVVFADPNHAVAVSPVNILGVLSLFIWSLILIVTLKYVIFIMRFDNTGEGGIVALMTLLLEKCASGTRLRRWFLPLGLLGAALFYGDGVITPAISVVSAVEGLETISPELAPYVVPVSVVILVLLFMVQSRGTEKIARLFGPVMLVWFVVIALLGVGAVVQNPEVLKAISPTYAWQFVEANSLLSFFVLGAVVLCMTGAEALYADMGHFGAKPIQRAWIFLVFPALVLNYLGQGALVLQNPDALHNPFFRMAPDWALHGLVGLATVATVVASQAVISGVFSMTQQLVQLRALPRMITLHTSDDNAGQIYVPAANWGMLVLVIVLVLYFQSSNAMGGAYGIAVTGTMLITDFFAIAVLVHVRRWPSMVALLLVLPFLVVDCLFFSANAIKLVDGGWFPVLLSVLILIIMTAWQRGVESIEAHEQQNSMTLKDFLCLMRDVSVYRSHGTAVCLTSNALIAPNALVLLHQRLHAVAEKVICLHVIVHERPYSTEENRFTIDDKGQGIYLVVLNYGYRDTIDIPKALSTFFPQDNPIERYGYVINRWSLDARAGDGWSIWRKRLFLVLLRNATPQWRLFKMPMGRTLEVGTRLVL